MYLLHVKVFCNRNSDRKFLSVETFQIFSLKIYVILYFLTWKIKLIYTLLIRCKFMCCSQHFTTYLLSLQNILFFDWRRASYVILLIYILDWYSLVYATPPNDISRLWFWKTERLPREHIPINFINENAIFLRIHVIVTL